METAPDREEAALPLVEIIRDAATAAAALKSPRPAILAALREPASASALAQRLGLPRQRLSHHIRELENVGLVRLVERRRRRGCVERVVQAAARRYLLSPDLLGEPGPQEPEDLLRLVRRQTCETAMSPTPELREGGETAVLAGAQSSHVPAVGGSPPPLPTRPNQGTIVPTMGTSANPPTVPTALADALFTPVQQRVLGLLFGQPARREEVLEPVPLDVRLVADDDRVVASSPQRAGPVSETSDLLGARDGAMPWPGSSRA